MTEIPLPPSDGYVEPSRPSKGPGCGKTIIIVLVIAIVVVGGIAIVLMSNFGNGGSSYETREIADYNNQDVMLSPVYYSGEFNVYSSEVQTSTEPDLLFEIDVNTGSDGVSVSVYCAIYDIDKDTLDAADTWAELDPYWVDDVQYNAPIDSYLNLYNYAETYTWVIWFEAAYKSDTWDVDITLTLRYNW